MIKQENQKSFTYTVEIGASVYKSNNDGTVSTYLLINYDVANAMAILTPLNATEAEPDSKITLMDLYNNFYTDKESALSKSEIAAVVQAVEYAKKNQQSEQYKGACNISGMSTEELTYVLFLKRIQQVFGNTLPSFIAGRNRVAANDSEPRVTPVPFPDWPNLIRKGD